MYYSANILYSLPCCLWYWKNNIAKNVTAITLKSIVHSVVYFLLNRQRVFFIVFSFLYNIYISIVYHLYIISVRMDVSKLILNFSVYYSSVVFVTTKFLWLLFSEHLQELQWGQVAISRNINTSFCGPNINVLKKNTIYMYLRAYIERGFTCIKI